MALRDSHTEEDTNNDFHSTDKLLAQTFTPTIGYDISYVVLKLYRTNSPGSLTIGIYATDGSGHPTGSALTSGTTDGDTLTTSTSGEERAIEFSSAYTLVAGTKYAIVAEAPDGSVVHKGHWRLEDTGTYSSGNAEVKSGASWGLTGNDHYFKTYDGVFLQPADKVYTRQNVSIGGNEVWYESTSGTLTELADANGDIDTSAPLTAVAAYGKIFVANQTNLKVADFINTKITTADIGSHPPDEGTVLSSDGTGNPSMIVDYITSLSGACTIYGKRTTTVTFADTETVTGTDDDGNSISFTLNADEDAPPHWYDYTVFGDDSSFGDFPSSLYLVALYMGCVIWAGNPDEPHQWYMSKIGFPFNHIYSATDLLTAVAGNNTKAGLVGDIIRALIPFGDEFFIFGCADSIHILDGHPADSGSIEKLSDDTGIFSWTSWCKDGDGNLYFYGRHGIYMMSGGRGKPKNISQAQLPKLASDWAIDTSLHRVVLGYDSERRGVVIVKTTISSGANEGYFYSLETQGFYPISFPDECGVYCAYDNESDDPDYRKLLFGTSIGYIMGFDDTAKDDDSGDSDTAISSYIGIVDRLSDDSDYEGKLTSLTFVTSGGASGGDFSDTDGVSYELHRGNDAETVLEDMKDGATAFTSGTLSGTGRQNRIRQRVRGSWIGIKLYNSTASETWGMNRIFGILTKAGRIK